MTKAFTLSGTKIFALSGKRPSLPDHNKCWIAPNASIIGDVRIDNMCSVWFGAVIRSDCEPIIIGRGTNIQDNCVLHVDPSFPLTIGKNCSIGHNATVHGCEIGDNTLVGMGAIILNGARIGNNCLIGANSVITEGQNIPNSSLVVGSPGRVVRTLDTRSVGALKRNAEIYQKRMQQYLGEFQTIEI